MAPVERRAFNSQQSWLQTAVTRLVYRLGRRQSVFSFVSALLAFTLGITLIVDFAFGAQPLDMRAVALWASSYFAFTMIPLALGRRYPWWLGLTFMAYLTALTALLLAFTDRSSFVMIALLELPIIGVYLGWFFVPWLARLSLMVAAVAIGTGVIIGPPLAATELSQELALVYAVLISIFCLETGRHLRRTADRQARRDPLTDVLNRRGFHSLARMALTRARRAGLDREPLVIVAIDLDDLKTLNDTRGHTAGDRALIESAEQWRRAVGPEDLVARTGGDEFILLIHGDERAARKLMQKCARKSQHRWSWGLATVAQHETIDQTLGRADAELYRSKSLKGI